MAKEMRAVLAQALIDLMEKNDKVVVLDADLANADGIKKVFKAFPERGIDVGISEQNMASVAAGMAATGALPFIVTFTPFATRRICDQVTISIAYAKRNVKIIGTDPGITAELNGGTHMSVEDVGVLRSIPGMVIFEPADGEELARAIPAIAEYDGPVYVRVKRIFPCPAARARSCCMYSRGTRFTFPAAQPAPRASRAVCSRRSVCRKRARTAHCACRLHRSTQRKM